MSPKGLLQNGTAAQYVGLLNVGMCRQCNGSILQQPLFTQLTNLCTYLKNILPFLDKCVLKLLYSMQLQGTATAIKL